MTQRIVDEEWEKRRWYLTHSLFQNLNPIIPEAQSEDEAFDDFIQNLPDLLVEIVPLRRVEDDPEESYEKLEKHIKYLLKLDSSLKRRSLSTDGESLPSRDLEDVANDKDASIIHETRSVNQSPEAMRRSNTASPRYSEVFPNVEHCTNISPILLSAQRARCLTFSDISSSLEQVPLSMMQTQKQSTPIPLRPSSCNARQISEIRKSLSPKRTITPKTLSQKKLTYSEQSIRSDNLIRKRCGALRRSHISDLSNDAPVREICHGSPQHQVSIKPTTFDKAIQTSPFYNREIKSVQTSPINQSNKFIMTCPDNNARQIDFWSNLFIGEPVVYDIVPKGHNN